MPIDSIETRVPLHPKSDSSCRISIWTVEPEGASHFLLPRQFMDIRKAYCLPSSTDRSAKSHSVTRCIRLGAKVYPAISDGTICNSVALRRVPNLTTKSSRTNHTEPSPHPLPVT